MGSAPIGCTKPLESSSTEAREPIRSDSEPTTFGRAEEGTARQIRSQPASSISLVRLTVTPSGSLTPGRYSSFSPLRAIWRAFSSLRVPSSTSSPPRASSTATAVPQLPAPITAALRSGGRPPSHSHCSSMFGQIRSVTVAASAGEGRSVRGKVSGVPARSRTLRGRMRQPRRTCSEPWTATGSTAAPVSSASRPTPRLGRAERARPDPGALGEDDDGAAALDDQARGLHRRLVGLAAADREGAEPGEDPALPALLEQLDLGDELQAAAPGQGRLRSRTGRGSCGGWRRRSARP